ncbi:MAG: FkbM family methyltransferase [Burkholderiales bacterium]
MPIKKIGTIAKNQIDLPWLKISFAEAMVGSIPLRYVETNRLSTKRMETLFTKEPTTIPWLECMQPGEVLVDIGANVGMYSIYAAKIAGVRVYAFEPEALNYAELNKNIYVNALHSQVTAYCLALSNETRVDRLLLGGFAEGLSHHDFGENTWTQDKDFGALRTSKDERLAQGCVSFSLDYLISSKAIPPPKHIKIDVDGLESKVVDGCWQTFTGSSLETVLIEIDHRIPSCLAIVDRMVGAGWKFSIDQLRTNRKVIFTVEQIERMRRNGEGGFNYIFFRDQKYEDLFRDFLKGFVPPMAKK